MCKKWPRNRGVERLYPVKMYRYSWSTWAKRMLPSIHITLSSRYRMDWSDWYTMMTCWLLMWNRIADCYREIPGSRKQQALFLNIPTDVFC